ncbi:hypothetical protein [Haloferula sp.]|uniref:hypothetical protein n=1 Tax=Haloferula sp. TaxID=2497595 RepID=UPI003C769F7B
MKSKSISLFSAITILAAQATNAATITFDNGNADNNWAVATNWNPDSVPDAGSDAAVVALISNTNIANISSAVPNVATVRIGNNSNGGTVNIQSGGSITAGTATQIATANGSIGTLNISGGTMSAASLQVAANNATATEGSVNITAGALSWTNGSIGTQGTGTINLIGDTATVSGTNLTLGSGGGLGFTLNSTGVSQISLVGLFSISATAVLDVDMLSYTGGSAAITLVDTNATLTGNFASGNISIATPAGYTASVLQDTDNGLVQLEITAVPEPGIAVLLGGFGMVIFVRNRSRQIVKA